MKCNISRFRFLFFSLLFSFSFILIAPTDTYATRVDVDVNHLDDYFTSVSGGGTISSDYFQVSSSNINRIFFQMTTSAVQSLSCSNYDVYSNIVYSDGFSSFEPSTQGSGGGYQVLYVSGSYNNGIIYHIDTRKDRAPIYGSVTSLTYTVNYKFQSITLGCSAEEVASQTPTPTPTPTPTEEPTPTPTEEPIPTPTVSPESTVNPNDYEYNQMEDTAVRYSFYAFCIICLSAFLIYEIIIKRIILK